MVKRIVSFFCDKSLVIFLIIGGLNTVVSMVGSQLLLSPFTSVMGEGKAYWASTALMFTFCGIFSFIFNRKYSFKSTAPLMKSIIKFVVVIAVCYVISFGISDFIAPILMGWVFPDVSSVWVVRFAMLVAQVIFTFCNYLGQRLWAFN